ncbi:type III-B CRISPR module-associated protein Cmr5 [Aliarcobacter butzleri]|uniref:type III-B CRISPR module-associated protein Cmr5 n=1 Tax=Aliarcobacter butzleri TaxID=28197 RepID=UPI003AFA26A8
MNNKNIEKLIPKAIDLLQKFPKEKVYQGYLASFGPTVITSGILQAVAFYSGDDKKKKVIKLMFDLIQDDLKTDKNTLLDFLKENDKYKDYAIKNKILEASIACKLAIRTFELKD